MHTKIGQYYPANEVLDYIESTHHSQQDVETGNLSLRVYVHQIYQLVELDVAALDSSPYYLDEELMDDYMALNTACPPIVYNLYNNQKLLIDGGHRLEVAKKKQHAKILALVGSDKPDWSEYDAFYDAD